MATERSVVRHWASGHLPAHSRTLDRAAPHRPNAALCGRIAKSSAEVGVRDCRGRRTWRSGLPGSQKVTFGIAGVAEG